MQFWSEDHDTNGDDYKNDDDDDLDKWGEEEGR